MCARGGKRDRLTEGRDTCASQQDREEEGKAKGKARVLLYFKYYCYYI